MNDDKKVLALPQRERGLTLNALAEAEAAKASGDTKRMRAAIESGKAALEEVQAHQSEQDAMILARASRLLAPPSRRMAR
jgi:hypothetical protein